MIKVQDMEILYVVVNICKNLLLKVSSVSARKLRCQSSTRLGSQPSQLASAWEISARTHHYMIYPPHLVNIVTECPLHDNVTPSDQVEVVHANV